MCYISIFGLSYSFRSKRMSGQKRPADPSTSSSSGAPPEKRREREGEDGGPSVSSAAGGSTAVETVIKLGGVSNSVRPDRSSQKLNLHLFYPAIIIVHNTQIKNINNFSGGTRH